MQSWSSVAFILTWSLVRSGDYSVRSYSELALKNFGSNRMGKGDTRSAFLPCARLITSIVVYFTIL